MSLSLESWSCYARVPNGIVRRFRVVGTTAGPLPGGMLGRAAGGALADYCTLAVHGGPTMHLARARHHLQGSLP